MNPTQDEQELDEILMNFAKRVEQLPRGKTYSWDDERRALLALKQRWQLEARVDELREYAGHEDDDWEGTVQIPQQAFMNRIHELQTQLTALEKEKT